MRVAAHMRLVQTELTPRPQRFLGGRETNVAALSHILRTTAEHNAEFFEGLADYLQNFAAWERDYTTIASPLRPGTRYPIIAEGELLWIQVAEFCRRIQLEPRARHYAHGALKPFICGEPSRMSWGPRDSRIQPWFMPVDPERVEIAIGVDPVAALVPGTRERLALLGRRE